MKMANQMKYKKMKIARHFKKYYRWMRLNWFYVKRVLVTEREIGGELHAC